MPNGLEKYAMVMTVVSFALVLLSVLDGFSESRQYQFQIGIVQVVTAMVYLVATASVLEEKRRLRLFHFGGVIFWFIGALFAFGHAAWPNIP